VLVAGFAAALIPLARLLNCSGAMSGEKHPGAEMSGCV
jgi:hypothetical protein